jgi:hypothetical protein
MKQTLRSACAACSPGSGVTPCGCKKKKRVVVLRRRIIASCSLPDFAPVDASTMRRRYRWKAVPGPVVCRGGRPPLRRKRLDSLLENDSAGAAYELARKAVSYRKAAAGRAQLVFRPRMVCHCTLNKSRSVINREARIVQCPP